MGTEWHLGGLPQTDGAGAAAPNSKGPRAEDLARGGEWGGCRERREDLGAGGGGEGQGRGRGRRGRRGQGAGRGAAGVGGSLRTVLVAVTVGAEGPRRPDVGLGKAAGGGGVGVAPERGPQGARQVEGTGSTGEGWVWGELGCSSCGVRVRASVRESARVSVCVRERVDECEWHERACARVRARVLVSPEAVFPFGLGSGVGATGRGPGPGSGVGVGVTARDMRARGALVVRSGV